MCSRAQKPNTDSRIILQPFTADKTHISGLSLWNQN